MILCLVTDRRRRPVLDHCRDAVRAGVDLIQIREPGLESPELLSLVVKVVDMTRDTPTRVVVNDRLDVALASGAHGVHLRGDSVPPGRARLMAPAGSIRRSRSGWTRNIGVMNALVRRNRTASSCRARGTGVNRRPS